MLSLHRVLYCLHWQCCLREWVLSIYNMGTSTIMLNLNFGSRVWFEDSDKAESISNTSSIEACEVTTNDLPKLVLFRTD